MRTPFPIILESRQRGVCVYGIVERLGFERRERESNALQSPSLSGHVKSSPQLRIGVTSQVRSDTVQTGATCRPQS